MEYKSTIGKTIEDSILGIRAEIKSKRNVVKDLTNKCNSRKKKIDALQHHIDKKEEERKMDQKAQELDFDDGEGENDIIIDEEELTMLKEQKEAKREYRDTYGQLQAIKREV